MLTSSFPNLNHFYVYLYALTPPKLEEIVNFRQFEERTSQRTHLHAVNRPDEKLARDHLLDVWRSRLDGCRVDAEVHSSILAIRSLVLGELRV